MIKNLPTLPPHLPPHLPPLHPPLQPPHRPIIHTTILKQVLFIIYYLIFFFILFTFTICIILQQEVFLWTNSELKDVYTIDSELTWAEQKEDIIAKLLPPLYKIVNKKYSVTNKKLLKMLYG